MYTYFAILSQNAIRQQRDKHLNENMYIQEFLHALCDRSKTSSKQPTMKLPKSPKTPSLISLRLRDKKGKICKTSYEKKYHFHSLIL